MYILSTLIHWRKQQNKQWIRNKSIFYEILNKSKTNNPPKNNNNQTTQQQQTNKTKKQLWAFYGMSIDLSNTKSPKYRTSLALQIGQVQQFTQPHEITSSQQFFPLRLPCGYVACFRRNFRTGLLQSLPVELGVSIFLSSHTPKFKFGASTARKANSQ